MLVLRLLLAGLAPTSRREIGGVQSETRMFPLCPLENRSPSLPQEIDFRLSPIVLAISEILQLKIGISALSCVSKGHIFHSVQPVHTAPRRA